MLCVLVFTAAVCRGARTGASPLAAWTGAALVSLVPQVLFLGAYVNQEPWSLAMSGLLAWALAADVRRRSWWTLAGVGAAAGGLLLGRFTF
ncbi:MAG: hypothetical protein R2712_12805 [Vicinamibacterales bacterium]